VPYVSSDPDDDRYMGKEIGSERSYATFEEHLEKLAEEAKECRSPINEVSLGLYPSIKWLTGPRMLSGRS